MHFPYKETKQALLLFSIVKIPAVKHNIHLPIKPYCFFCTCAVMLRVYSYIPVAIYFLYGYVGGNFMASREPL